MKKKVIIIPADEAENGDHAALYWKGHWDGFFSFEFVCVCVCV